MCQTAQWTVHVLEIQTTLEGDTEAVTHPAGRLTRDPVETMLGSCTSHLPNKYPQTPLLHYIQITYAANFYSSAGHQ